MPKGFCCVGTLVAVGACDHLIDLILDLVVI
jgi:hypothetical protein